MFRLHGIKGQIALFNVNRLAHVINEWLAEHYLVNSQKFPKSSIIRQLPDVYRSKGQMACLYNIILFAQ